MLIPLRVLQRILSFTNAADCAATTPNTHYSHAARSGSILTNCLDTEQVNIFETALSWKINDYCNPLKLIELIETLLALKLIIIIIVLRKEAAPPAEQPYMVTVVFVGERHTERVFYRVPCPERQLMPKRRDGTKTKALVQSQGQS